AVAARVVRHWPEPRIASVARTNPGAGNNLFSKPLDAVLAALPQEASKPSFGTQSILFPAYGLASLQSGSQENRTASLLFFGSYGPHSHADQLNLLLFSQGNALLTDIGYPMQTDAFNHQRFAWYSNTVSHNTVTVDAAMQSRGRGRLHAYQPAGPVQLVDASCEGTYPGKLTLYRRVNMLVELSPTQSYLFDVFHVRGGRQHDYVALGAPAETTCEPALGPAQEKGTLAGLDVGYEQFYDDPVLAAKPLGTISYGSYCGSGFQYLFNVRRAALRTRAVFQWRLKKPDAGTTQYPWEGIGLRAHLLGDGDEIIAAEGKPQRYAYLPQTVQFLLRRRTGDNLASAFVTVYEPYRQTPLIRRIVPVSLEPNDGETVAARIELADGAAHYVCHSLKPDRPCTLDGRLRFSGQAACLVLDAQDKPQRAMLFNGRELALGPFVLSGAGLRRTRVKSIDYSTGVIETKEPVLTGPELAGQTVLVEPEGLAEATTLSRVLDATHFSIGDADLRVAAGPVSRIDSADNRLVTPVATPHVRTGMTVLNSRLQPQGRVLQLANGLVLDRAGRAPVTSQDFPAGPDDSGPRFSVVVIGPGDEVCIPSLATFDREAK
ncbi:MAG: heparinase II/III family protein, partial [Pirellulales bacterium]|nr:heparinase II/III family protein [Pirellulales bacterium]